MGNGTLALLFDEMTARAPDRQFKIRRSTTRLSPRSPLGKCGSITAHNTRRLGCLPLPNYRFPVSTTQAPQPIGDAAPNGMWIVFLNEMVADTDISGLDILQVVLEILYHG